MTDSSARQAARWAGIVVQSVILGTLLALACVELFIAAGGATVFRYQAF